MHENPEVIISSDVELNLKEKAKSLGETERSQRLKYHELCLEHLVITEKDPIKARAWMAQHRKDWKYKSGILGKGTHDEMLEKLMDYALSSYKDGVKNDEGAEIVCSLYFIKLFLDYQFNPYIHSEGKPSILTTAIKEQHKELISLFLDAKAMPRWDDDLGFALAEAIKQNDITAIKRLLAVGKSILPEPFEKEPDLLKRVLNSTQYTDNGTLFHLAAAQKDSEKIVLLLMAHGANPEIRNSEDKTSADIACAEGNAAVAVKIFYHLQSNLRFGKRHKNFTLNQKQAELSDIDTTLSNLQRTLNSKPKGLGGIFVSEPSQIYDFIKERIAEYQKNSLELNTLIEVLLERYHRLKREYLLENPKGLYLNTPASSRAKAIKPKLDALKNSIAQLTKHAVVKGLINEGELNHFIDIMKKNCVLDINSTGMGESIYKNENNYIFKDFKQELEKFALVNKQQGATLYQDESQVSFEPISKFYRQQENKLAKQSMRSLITSGLRVVPDEEVSNGLVTSIRLHEVYLRLSNNKGCVLAADYFDYYDIKRLVRDGASLEAALVLANIHAEGLAPETCIETDENIMLFYQEVKENCQNQLQDLHTSESLKQKLQQILHYIDMRVAMFSKENINDEALFAIFHLIASDSLYKVDAKLFLDKIIGNSTLDPAIIEKAKLIKAIYNDEISSNIKTLLRINFIFYESLLAITQAYGEEVPPEWQLNNIFVPSAPQPAENPEFSVDRQNTEDYIEGVIQYRQELDAKEQLAAVPETYSPCFFNGAMRYYDRVHGEESIEKMINIGVEEVISLSTHEQNSGVVAVTVKETDSIKKQDKEQLQEQSKASITTQAAEIDTLSSKDQVKIKKLEELEAIDSLLEQGKIEELKKPEASEILLADQSQQGIFSKKKDSEKPMKKEKKMAGPQLA